MGQGGVCINMKVVIQGNVIGNKDYANQLGNEITGRIMEALGNT